MLSGGAVSAQNLVMNPSFEAYENCPKRLGNFHQDVAFWSSPTLGSTDYFNACSTSMGTPENFNGQQSADFGKGYAGLYLFAPDDYREYIQVSLTEKLVKDVTYELSFYVSLAERSDFAVKEFGVLFSEQKIEIPIKKVLSKMHLYKDGGNRYNFMEIGYTNFYRDTKDWILVNTKFQAKGTEKFITIGNFNSNARTRKFRTRKGGKDGAYYYIDMVAVEAPGTSAKTSGVSDAVVFELDRLHEFKNVLFEFDTYVLLSSAKEDLKHIYGYLEANPTLGVTIHGHTDGIGTAAYNKRLSERRCLAVKDYLTLLGLNEERISFKAHGGSKPIADNATEQGRLKNRRVEFVFAKQRSP